MKKQSKNCKNNEEANISPKTVAAMVADDSIRDTYMMCKEHTSPSVRMLTGMVGIRKYESRRITFGVQTLSGNKNKRTLLIQYSNEYICNNERKKLAEEIAPAKGYGLPWTYTNYNTKTEEVPELLDEYIKTLLEEGFIEKVKNQNRTWRVSYLPHQAVITPQESITMLRVAFDASAKTKAHR
ncbi:hypothetical protein LOAG_18741 [Loa loa]|uniref:Uncharacterized protein n=1 Tax=Loa loa TaxID=7209 RepID=A0A1S0UDX8_LOALO|nr:hypothetical protein LOAG_18741 [Loa loa]EJD73870.1 hypothetical protein LOAG_18741 [Loa loa]